MALAGFALERLDGERDVLYGGPNRACGRLILDVELAESATPNGVEASRKGIAARSDEGALDRPVFLGLERLDLELAITDEAQRHRLDTSGRAGARKLAPQDRG